jgi:hypothetical protein
MNTNKFITLTKSVVLCTLVVFSSCKKENTDDKKEPIATKVKVTNLTVNDAANAADWSIRENLQSGDVLFGDRTYAITELPASLKGSVWIRTANDSRSFTTVGSDLATFKIDKDADVYIAHADAVTPKPVWLSSWVKETASDMFILTNEATPQRFSIYKKRFTAGSTVTVGLNGHTSRNMYFIIVK